MAVERMFLVVVFGRCNCSLTWGGGSVRAVFITGTRHLIRYRASIGGVPARDRRSSTV